MHVPLLERTVALMEAQGEGLAEFIASDPKGQKLPVLLSRVTSDGSGHGASFCLTLPRRHAPAD